ncbi:hypothetical protein C1H46_017183 [Malus baccata]|uniref:Uncharacterized protein n=1 Tax=Malus baccata TaxID=106549 RepID=A0A540MEE4_MALBA|nr:hypothetical protein C1H46_017183 [Malus baccata]
MASCKVISRLSSRLQPFARNLTKTLPASELSQLKSSFLSPASAPMRRISGLSRLPVELGSMMPLHSAVASARLISSLSIDSQSWGLVPQEAVSCIVEWLFDCPRAIILSESVVLNYSGDEVT